MMPSDTTAECWNRAGGDVFVLMRAQVCVCVCVCVCVW